MNKLFLVGFLILAAAAFSAHAECVDGEFKQAAPITIGDDGVLVTVGEAGSGEKESDFSTFFKKVGCSLKKGASKVKEGAKKLGGEIKEGAKKFKAVAKEFGSDVKTKFGEFKEKLSDSSEEALGVTTQHSLFANVELINTDIKKAEEKCGNGYILDVLGNCKQL